MRVEKGVPTPTHNEYDDAAENKQAIVSKTSAAGEGSGKHAAGLPEEEAAADDDDDEDI